MEEYVMPIVDGIEYDMRFTGMSGMPPTIKSVGSRSGMKAHILPKSVKYEGRLMSTKEFGELKQKEYAESRPQWQEVPPVEAFEPKFRKPSPPGKPGTYSQFASANDMTIELRKSGSTCNLYLYSQNDNVRKLYYKESGLTLNEATRKRDEVVGMMRAMPMTRTQPKPTSRVQLQDKNIRRYKGYIIVGKRDDRELKIFLNEKDYTEGNVRWYAKDMDTAIATINNYERQKGITPARKAIEKERQKSLPKKFAEDFVEEYDGGYITKKKFMWGGGEVEKYLVYVNKYDLDHGDYKWIEANIHDARKRLS